MKRTFTSRAISITREGSTHVFLTTKAPYRDARGEVIGLVCISHDITDRKLLEEKLRADATHDPLTGTFNRAALDERLSRLKWECPAASASP